MLYTLTTNPAIDMNVSTRGIVPGAVNRTFDTVYTPNGKGLNVSFVLKHFGVESNPWFFRRVFRRLYCERIQKKGH